MKLTGKMLLKIKNRVEDKFKQEGINLIPFIGINSNKKITLVLSCQGNKEADLYFEHNKESLLKLINDCTYLSWRLDETDNYIFVSGYVVFSEETDMGLIQQFNVIEGDEFEFDSIYRNGKETTTHEIVFLDPDINDFEFERKLPPQKRKTWTWLIREKKPDIPSSHNCKGRDKPLLCEMITCLDCWSKCYEGKRLTVSWGNYSGHKAMLYVRNGFAAKGDKYENR